MKNFLKVSQLNTFFLIIFTSFTNLIANENTSPHFLQQLEMGYSYLDAGKITEAHLIFQPLLKASDPLIHHFAHLGLAKIALEENNFSKADGYLKKLDLNKETFKLAVLKYELLYTKADFYFRQNQIDEAIIWLEKALPQKNENLSSWATKTKFLLTKAYLKKAENSSELKEKRTYFEKAESHLSVLIDQEDIEFDFLQLAISYINMAEKLNNYEILNPFKDGPFSKLKTIHYPKKEEVLIKLGNVVFEKGFFDWAAYYFEGADLTHYLIALIHASKEIPWNTINLNPEEKILIQAEFLAKNNLPKEALALLEAQELSPPLHEKQLFLMGILAYKEDNFSLAVLKFQSLCNLYPQSNLAPSAIFWSGRSLENQSFEKAREKYALLQEQFPNHPLNDEAYFYSYSLQDYLMGERAALKHLHLFKDKFPSSPLRLYAEYLQGLDYLHDRRSREGKWITRQNLIAAIDAFQNVETLFDSLAKDRLSEPLNLLRYQAILERAKTNLKVAESAKMAKKTIYLDYARDVFESLISKLEQIEPLHPIYEEALYYLAFTEKQRDSQDNALKHLETLIAEYEKAGIKTGYLLSCCFYQKGLILSEKNQIDESLVLFDLSATVGNNFLSRDEILNLMIAKAKTLRSSGQLDAAMLQLSEVVNYNTASHLRLEAMYLRAEIYDAQGRKALAQKQLESIALKSGPWALKAQEHLEKYYGFD